MPKKNKGRNGFFYFMCDFRDRRGITMAQASTQAGAVWDKLSPAEKQPYFDRAQSSKSSDKGVQKYTSLNEDVELIGQKEEEKKLAEHRMKKDIESTVRRFIDGETMPQEYFHIIHINYFCYAITEKQYFPAEIALLRFNFTEGVQEHNIYHSEIQPGSLPKGYAYSAKVKSEESHQIPPPIIDAPASNMYEIIQRVILFMREQEVRKELPPIYASEGDVGIFSEILAQMCDENELDRNMFKVYSLQYLLHTLRNNLEGQIVWPTVTQSILELERDVYDYTDGICCYFHETCDSPIFCSKSIITRFAFILCENCCQSMRIPLMPGHHIPKNKKVSQAYSSTAASTVTARSSSSSNSDRYSTAVDEEEWMTAKSRNRCPSRSSASVFSTGSPESVRRKPVSKSMATGSNAAAGGSSGLSMGASGSGLSMGGASGSGYIPPMGRGRGRGGHNRPT